MPVISDDNDCVRRGGFAWIGDLISAKAVDDKIDNAINPIAEDLIVFMPAT
jgi:hypothetical protein